MVVLIEFADGLSFDVVDGDVEGKFVLKLLGGGDELHEVGESFLVGVGLVVAVVGFEAGLAEDALDEPPETDFLRLVGLDQPCGLSPVGERGVELGDGGLGAGVDGLDEGGLGEEPVHRGAVGEGVGLEGVGGFLADAAGGVVDDAKERDLVGGVGDGAEVGDGVLDLLAVVEGGAAGDLIGMPALRKASSTTRERELMR